jgi:hypothetical protein
MILILGKGTLAQAVHAKVNNSICVGRPEYDFSSKTDCDRLIDQYDPLIVVNTVAVNQTNNIWDILVTNYVSSSYITAMFSQKMNNGLIINVSSASTMWVSYPGIDTNRMFYNLSKQSLSDFGRHWQRKTVDDNNGPTLCTIELGKFPSKFNNYQEGTDVDIMAGHVVDVINNPKQHVTIV